ncbi:hypothetical protein BXU09_17905 [Deinococcus sp. LM3]|nr:hypothetical protein BXU09_17905 [Deinococcus sp. LM3]
MTQRSGIGLWAVGLHRAAELLTAYGGCRLQGPESLSQVLIQPDLMIRAAVAQDASPDQVTLQPGVHEQRQAGTLAVIPALGVAFAGLLGGAGRSRHP